ncbi:pyridoxamine 5'-phosphate oxidase [mine drainage metagenome]|uniref:Pyridoxamine 5'-phosphate oxidase n=1 Tax=mine drainage metagenome TaxID=410659 RepID=A0A1J5R4L9_9ZZZZ
MLTQSPRSTPRVKAVRASLDRAAANAILDEAPICHVGFCTADGPAVIPTIHWRVEDRLYFHGSPGSRLAGVMAAGQDLCVTVTLLDGLVLARSAFAHSMNYRSVVLFGQAQAVSGEAEKHAAFAALMDKLAPGRAALLRPTSAKEYAATQLLAFPIQEGAVKCRKGPPADVAGDETAAIWAGVVPLTLTAGPPEADALTPPGQTLGYPAL